MHRFRSAAAVTALVVVAIVGLSVSGVLSDRAAGAVDDLGQLAGAMAAAVACGITGLRAAGRERRWRLLMAAAFVGWGTGQGIWTYYQLIGRDAIPSPSLADVGYLTLPVFALPSLLVLAAGRSRRARRDERSGRSRLVLVLDALVIVGSMSILAWTLVLSAVVEAGAPTAAAFAVAVAYPVSDLMLVVIVLLTLTLRRVGHRPQLLLLALGLVAISCSDSTFAYLVSSGAQTLPLAGDIGFVAGPYLVALAAVAPASIAAREGSLAGLPGGLRWHLLVPYLPLTAVGILLLVQTSLGRSFGRIEVYLGLLVVTLVVTRQVITLRENTLLLEQVRDSQAELAHQAFHDPLRGLPNRALFGDRLAHAADVHRDERRPLGLLFVDLDEFKVVNDTLGHAAGDALLQQVGQRLRGCVPAADTVARLGGDEFAVLVESDLAPGDVADRVTAALDTPFLLERQSRTVRASVGVVVADGQREDVSAELLLRRADAAMYAAKRGGGAAVVTYEPGLISLLDDPDLPFRLADALHRGAVDVAYQPIVRLSDGSTVAVEALARWTDGDRGPVPPEVFVAAAERTGLIAELDDHVLNRACRDMAWLRARSGIPLAVHVNVSATRLADPALGVAVRAALDRNRLPAAALVLEITETSMVPDVAAATPILQRLRGEGVRVALDDFGTGYGTLATLHVLPIDVVKLDRTLAVPAGDPGRGNALRRSVVSISRTLGMLIVGEGIETAQQAAELGRLGCDLGQGYYFGRPEPVDRLRLVAPYVPQEPLTAGAPRPLG
ncbi:MAG TPA: bifunctional diguanylate cyclase/phosphodiesterase [Mycobacteriales bacterium]|nr:bifunctional diguanylate cyclase/phosphodiesterase [Mycobacteriales bacterium]